MTMGLAGHGMLLAPVCPCRVVRVEDLLIIGRDYAGPLLREVVIKEGAAPATEPPSGDGEMSLGPDGPTLTLDGVELEEVILRIDVGTGPGGWDVLAPGFWFGMPRGMVLYSPDPEEEGDLPELHHAQNTDAMIVFQRVGRDAGELVVTGPGGVALQRGTIETEAGVLNTFAYQYEHADDTWVQQKIALPYGPGRTILMTAQAPVELWSDVLDAAVHIAQSFAPIED